MVFAHNPSAGIVEYVRVKTSHANYDVYEYVNDVRTRLPAEAVCVQKFLEDESHIQDCDIFVDVRVEGIKRIAFHYNAKANLALPEISTGKLSISS